MTSRLDATRRKAKRSQLRERDGDRCWLCQRPMQFGGHPCGDEYATIDHVHPRSTGGDHDLTNLKLAHRACNLQRANKPPVEVFNPRIGVKRSANV